MWRPAIVDIRARPVLRRSKREKSAHTHTHTYAYIRIYVHEEDERNEGNAFLTAIVVE